MKRIKIMQDFENLYKDTLNRFKDRNIDFIEIWEDDFYFTSIYEYLAFKSINILAQQPEQKDAIYKFLLEEIAKAPVHQENLMAAMGLRPSMSDHLLRKFPFKDINETQLAFSYFWLFYSFWTQREYTWPKESKSLWSFSDEKKFALLQEILFKNNV